MRTYGRIVRPEDKLTGKKTWVRVDLDDTGDPSAIWTTTLVQCLKLNLGESPFYSNYGLPAKASVVQQIAPDFDMAKTQRQFAQYFANLLLARLPDDPVGDPTPRYRMVVTTNFGHRITGIVAQ